MEAKSLIESLEKYLKEYAPQCEESVRRNSHMNTASGLSAPESIAGTLGVFVLSVPAHYRGGDSKIDVLTAMSDAAKAFVKPFDDKFVHAAVVDFVNFVGLKNGVDYAMYTADL